MNVSGISNSRLGFSGIYGTATRIAEDGTKTPIKINLPGKYDILEITDSFSNVKGQVKLFSCENPKTSRKSLEAPNISYENVKIDQVDQKSFLDIDAYGVFHIGTLKDNARLRLDEGKDKLGLSVVINKIEGSNVRLF